MRLIYICSQRRITPMNDALLLSSHALLTGSTHSLALVVGTGSVIIGLELQESTTPVLLCRKGGNGHLLGDHGSGAFRLQSQLN